MAASDIRRLAVTTLGLVSLLVAVDLLASALFQDATAGSALQDPRQRILWGSPYDGSPVVLIGDLVFHSYFIDTPDQALWSRLAERLGGPVFPATLNAATPRDMLSISRRVARFWPPGTTALIGIHAVHLFGPGVSEIRREAEPAVGRG